MIRLQHVRNRPQTQTETQRKRAHGILALPSQASKEVHNTRNFWEISCIQIIHNTPLKRSKTAKLAQSHLPSSFCIPTWLPDHVTETMWLKVSSDWSLYFLKLRKHIFLNLENLEKFDFLCSRKYFLVSRKTNLFQEEITYMVEAQVEKQSNKEIFLTIFLFQEIISHFKKN